MFTSTGIPGRSFSPGFGSFTLREYKAYRGRNPKSGETVQVEPKRLPYFKVGKELKEMVWKDEV